MRPDKETIPNKLRDERERRGWRREYVVEKIKCDLKSLGRWERGEVTPSPYYRQQLCELFGMNAEELGLMPKDTSDTPSEGSTSHEVSREDTDATSQERAAPSNSLDQTAPPGRNAEEFERTPGDEPVVPPVPLLPPRGLDISPPEGFRAKLRRLPPPLAISGILLICACIVLTGLVYLLERGTPQSKEQPAYHLLYTYRLPSGKAMYDVEWSPRGDALACITAEGTAQVITIAGGAYIPGSNTPAFNTVTWSPDGTRVASPGPNKTIQVWDPINGASVSSLQYPGHTAVFISVAWSRDGTRIASSDANGSVHIWNAATSGHILTYSGHTGRVWWIAWSPDGKRIASAGADATVQIWDAVTGKTLLTYKGHKRDVVDVKWSHDGKRLVSASEDRTVQIWDATTGKTLLTYHGHTNSVQAAEWSPNDKYIASGSADTTVQLWDAVTGKLLLTYRGHSKTVWALAWASAGKRIASASEDGTVQVWQITQILR